MLRKSVFGAAENLRAQLQALCPACPGSRFWDLGSQKSQTGVKFHRCGTMCRGTASVVVHNALYQGTAPAVPKKPQKRTRASAPAGSKAAAISPLREREASEATCESRGFGWMIPLLFFDTGSSCEL